MVKCNCYASSSFQKIEDDMISPTFIDIRQKFKVQQNFGYNAEEYSRPQSALLGVTNDCNLSCPYCFAEQSEERMSFEIAEKTVLWLLDNCRKKNAGSRPQVGFFGGEPLLEYSEIIVPLVEKYYDKVDFTITTNGVLLNEDTVFFLYQHNVSVLLSFDGIPEVQNSQRPGQNFNSFEAVLNNIPYLLLRLPHTTMRSTITKESIPYLFESYKMAEELGFLSMAFIPNTYESWEEEDLVSLNQQIDKIATDIYHKLLQGRKMPVSVNLLIDAEFMVRNFFEGNLFFNNSVLRCGLGTTSCAITPSGDIIPCQEKTSSPTFTIGHISKGIDNSLHEHFLQWYWDSINQVQGYGAFSPIEALGVLSSTCPSRSEDLDFKISSSEKLFMKAKVRLGRKLYTLCSNHIDPRIRKYFKEEVMK